MGHASWLRFQISRLIPTAAGGAAAGALIQAGAQRELRCVDEGVFVAEELVQGPHQRDAEESDMEIVRLPIAVFEQKLRTGEIRDVCTLAAWAGYRLWRDNPDRSASGN